MAAMLGLDGPKDQHFDDLVRRYRLRLVALTRGDRGSLLVAAEDRSELPAPAVDVVDTVGAGDAFTAALAMGLLQGWPLEEINGQAAEVAAFVCTHPGGAPDLPAALRLHYGTAMS